MPRRVWPHAFQLFACDLADAYGTGRAREVVAKLFAEQPGSGGPLAHAGMPVALRWTTTPKLGFPRQPFNVLRRAHAALPVRDLQVAPVTVTGRATIRWSGAEVIELVLLAQPDPGQVLSVEVLDRRSEVIFGQRVACPAPRIGHFRTPGIAALRVTGRGRVSAVRGVDQFQLANAAGWELVEVVGFPFKAGEIAPPAYDPRPQGWPPPARNGAEAALLRLTIARVMQLPLPPIGAPGVPEPVWPDADPAPYLQTVRTLVLPLVADCLANTDDANPGRLQVKYHRLRNVPGIRQADIVGAPTSPDPASANLPVVATTLIPVSTGSAPATALGYGTIDFPPLGRAPVPRPGPSIPGLVRTISVPGRVEHGRVPMEPAPRPVASPMLPPAERLTDLVVPAAAGVPVAEPPGTVANAFDYMVTATFVLPDFGAIELAALSQGRAPPEAPTGLLAATRQVNRAPARDLPESESVELSWRLSTLPQGHGLVASYNPGQSRILNSHRPIDGGYDPYVALRPSAADGENPFDARSRFIDPVAPLPLSGVATSSYFVIGQDPFGRWSSWSQALHPVSARPVARPGIHSARLLPDAGAVVGTVPCSLEIEFSWDWSDRAPDRVELASQFFAPTGTPSPTFDAGFAMSPEAAPGAKVVVTFDAVGNGTIDAAHAGTLERLTDALPPHAGSDPRSYRLTITGLSCDFTMAEEYALALYARAAERVRPTELSEVSGPRVARVSNPLPPPVPAPPSILQWTALPDSTGRARGLLSWPAVAGVRGYVVWEATETAIRHMVDSTLPDPEDPALPAAQRTLQARATALMALLAAPANAVKSLQAFSRVSSRLLTVNQLEVELPGASRVIYAYRISSVGTSNEESERSSIALFAVPKRNQPGQPRLMLRAVRQSPWTVNGVAVPVSGPGIAAIALPGPGVAAVGYAVYRVRNPALLRDLGLMGPPKVAFDDPGWRGYDVPSLSGAVEQGRAIFDAVEASWYPYFYRVVALGGEDVAAGEYGGESQPSAVQQGFRPPAGDPLLDSLAIAGNDEDRVLTFRTDLPVKPTPLGAATVEVLEVDLSGGRPVRIPVVSVLASEVAEGPPLAPLPAPTPADLAAMPQVARGAPDAEGRVVYTVRMAGSVKRGVVAARDPVGRLAELDFLVT